MYKITIQKITTTEYPEKKDVYVKDGKTYASKYQFEGDPDATETKTTGMMLERKTEEKVFEQTIEELDVGSLAVFLNEK